MTVSGPTSSSFEDLLELCIEAEADQRYVFDKESKIGQRKCAGSCEKRFLFAELEKSKLLRKKKRHRSVKPHRACRSNDCKFTPSGTGNGPFFMKARNHARIGRNRAKSEPAADRVPVQTTTNYDSYLLTENNIRRHGFDDDVDLARFLIALQNGTDITPEDYDRLLKLDEINKATGAAASARQRVADRLLRPDSIEAGDRLSVSTDKEEDSPAQTCTICMEIYADDSANKTLPCGHVFHTECLRRWWILSPNITCPLDNVDVRSMRPHFEGRVTEPSKVPLRIICI